MYTRWMLSLHAVLGHWTFQLHSQSARHAQDARRVDVARLRRESRRSASASLASLTLEGLLPSMCSPFTAPWPSCVLIFPPGLRGSHAFCSSGILGTTCSIHARVCLKYVVHCQFWIVHAADLSLDPCDFEDYTRREGTTPINGQIRIRHKQYCYRSAHALNAPIYTGRRFNYRRRTPRLSHEDCKNSGSLKSTSSCSAPRSLHCC